MPTFIASPLVNEKKDNELMVLLFDDTGDSILHGSKPFFKEVLETMGVEAEPVGWAVVACRSDYFSEYLGEENWLDVWRSLWKTSIELDTALKEPVQLPDIFVESGAIDDSYVHDKRLTNKSITNCLVIADFELLDELEMAAEKIRGFKPVRSDLYVDANVRMTTVQIVDQYFQLHIDLGKVKPEFYVEGAKDAEAVQQICKGEGGTVHFQDRFA